MTAAPEFGPEHGPEAGHGAGAGPGPAPSAPDAELRTTPLHDRHVALGARMVPFAGYAMPVQYPTGIIAEHKWTRTHAGLFDVSHMGQAVLIGPNWETTARAIEALVPADVVGLGAGRQRYTQLLDAAGGILDDLMVSRDADPSSGALTLVVNAARKHADFAWIGARLPEGITLTPLPALALLALQGPAAGAVLTSVCPAVETMGFMDVADVEIGSIPATVSRSGYTGEDGFEISVEGDAAGDLMDLLLAHPDVKPIGLGARDSLRLEAGLCLHGHDIDETTSPVEAGLSWSIGKRRREAGGFPGAARILAELADGPARVRVGLRPESRTPAREGAEILSTDGRRIGTVTSGGFGPTVDAPIAMGLVEAGFAAPGTDVSLVVRGKAMPARVAALPFVPARFKRARS